MNAVKESKQAPEMVEQKEIAKMEILKPLKPTADERIKRAEQFEILAQRFEILTEKKNSLGKFLIADDGTQGCTLILKSAGKSFEMNNNAVIKEVLTSAKVKLDTLIEITEAEVLNFII
ncbi:MAG: hypothetical protein V4608_03355 [Bacteroidota bacterium]